MVEYNERLAEAMKDARMSTSDLARHMGVSYQAVKKVENGGSFGMDNNILAAKALGVRSEWLATGAGPKVEGAVIAREPESEWPFPKVSLSRVLALEEDDRGYVQRRLLQAIEECELATASVDEQRQAERILKPAKKSRSSVKKAA